MSWPGREEVDQLGIGPHEGTGVVGLRLPAGGEAALAGGDVVEAAGDGGAQATGGVPGTASDRGVDPVGRRTSVVARLILDAAADEAPVVGDAVDKAREAAARDWCHRQRLP